MRNRGVRRPGRSVLICAAMLVGGALSVWSGVADMNALGHETTSTALRIGVGLLVAIIGGLMIFNFAWGMRVIAAMQGGRDVIARWTVGPHSVDSFRDADRERGRTEGDNDYRVPRRTPGGGLQVVFSADGVLIGDTFFGLASTGLSRFTGVRLRRGNPPFIEFGTRMTAVTQVTHVRVLNTAGVLRVPVAPDAEAQAAGVVRHYGDVIERRVIVKPDFWRWRMRLGLWVAVVSAVAAGIGFGLAHRSSELSEVPLVMAVGGVIFGLGGLLLAFLAFMLERFQRRG
jgi:hypothetical protein